VHSAIKRKEEINEGSTFIYTHYIVIFPPSQKLFLMKTYEENALFFQHFLSVYIFFPYYSYRGQCNESNIFAKFNDIKPGNGKHTYKIHMSVYTIWQLLSLNHI